MTITSSGIKIQKYSPNLGAVITGVDLSKEINEDQFKDIHKAFLDNQVLFFQNQNEILPEIHLKLGKLFGELHVHPAACLLYTSPSPRDRTRSRMPSSA